MVVRTSEGKFLEILEPADVIGLPIEVDLYDGSDPDTMLATLEHAREVGFGTQLSETGAGVFTINRQDHKATDAILAIGNLVRVKVGGVYRFAYWIEEPDVTDVSAKEQSGEDRTIPGRGALGGLDRARVYPPIWPPAPAAYVSRDSTDNGSGATSIHVPKPAGATSGMVVLIQIVSGGVTPSAPKGWKRIRNTTNSSLRATLFRKRLVSGEPSSWKFTWPSSTAAIAQSVALRNATSDDTQYGISDTTGSGTTIKLPSLNVGVVDGVLLGFAAVAAATSVTQPGGWTEVSDVASAGHTSEIARLPAAPVLGDTGDLNATAGTSAAWIGMQVFVPSTGSTDATFGGATLGGVLKTLIDEAQARGAIPWLTYDFDGEVDSHGEPWPDTFDLSFHVGTSLLDVWRHLVSLGLEGWITPALKLQAFVDASRHFEDTVVLRKGRHFTGDVKRSAHAAPLATRLLVEGAGGRVIEVSDPPAEVELRIGRREGYVGMATSDDATTLQRAGDFALEFADLDTRGIDVDVAHGPRTAGHYEPWVDYREGDWISVDTDGDGLVDPERVVAINLKKVEGGYVVNLDLNSIEQDAAERLQRKVDALSGSGSSGGSSLGLGGSSTGGGTSSTNGLVAVRPSDAPGYLADKLETDPATITKTVVGEAGSQRLRLAGVPSLTNPMTAAGDLIVGGAAGAPTRLAHPAVDGYLHWDPSTLVVEWRATSTIHPNLAAHDALGLATDAELAAHAAAGDPHPGYATDGDVTSLAAAAAAADAAHAAAADPHTGYQRESEKGTASGYAGLDSGTHVPQAQLGTGSAGAGAKFLADDQTYKTPAGGVSLGSATPLVESGTGSPGSASDASREDHVHPDGGGGGGGAGTAIQAYVGRNAIGASWETMSARRVYLKKFVLGAASQFVSLDVYIRPNTDNVVGLYGMLLTDNAGVADKVISGGGLKASDLYLSNSGSMPGGGRWFSLPVLPYLAPGTYWLAVTYDGTGAIDLAYDTGGTADSYFTSSVLLVVGAYPSAWAITATSPARSYSIRASTLTIASSTPTGILGQTLHATYGDDFDGPALDAKWTRVNVTSGEETFSEGYLDLALGTGTQARSYYQTPGSMPTNMELILGPIESQELVANQFMFGLYFVDNTGAGIGWSLYYDGNAYEWNLAGYAYSSTGNALGGVGGTLFRVGLPYFLRLRKAGTNYFGSVSYGTRQFSSETAAGSFSGATRIGFGRMFTSSAGHRISVGRFNVI